MPTFKRPLSPLHQVAFTDSWSISILHVFSSEVQIDWKVVHYFPVFNVLFGTEGTGNHSSHTTGRFPFRTYATYNPYEQNVTVELKTHKLVGLAFTQSDWTHLRC